MAMTRLLLGAALVVNLGVFLTPRVSGIPAPPVQVRFKSVDYKNVLHWAPESNGSGVHYYVQWKIYGESKWLDVDGCQGTQKHKCDLSRVTSDPSEWYYARVRASAPPSGSSGWTLSLRFSPRWDTTFSEPALNLNATEGGILVWVERPHLPVWKVHSNLFYKIFLTDSKGKEEEFDLACCSASLLLKKLQHKTKYCIQAQTRIPWVSRSSARSAPECVITL